MLIYSTAVKVPLSQAVELIFGDIHDLKWGFIMAETSPGGKTYVKLLPGHGELAPRRHEEG